MKRNSSFMPNWINLFRFMKDPAADWKPKAAIGLSVLYLVWPIDLVPDFAPLLGWLDDIGVTALAVAYLMHAANLYASEHPRIASMAGDDNKTQSKGI